MEILNYEECSGGSTLATFSIYWGPQFGMTFHKWKLIQTKSGSLFVAAPSFSKDTDLMGKKEWFPFIEFSKEKGTDFQKKVLELLQPFLRK
jgi:hypothetical protein